jgi:hypothetical protein
MVQEEAPLESPDRCAPVVAAAMPARTVALVATPARWVACSAAIAGGFVVATAGVLAFVHSSRPLSSLESVFAWVAALGALLSFVLLRAEESRIARELRIARTGTPALRGLAARRREQLPFFARPFSANVAVAAVCLADGDREAAADALRRGSPLMRGGRIDRLRAIVEADLERATRGSGALERVIERLRAMPAIGHREADRYRTHVLVKSVLERGDVDTAHDLALELGAAADPDQTIYATWLRVWFDLDDENDGGDDVWPPLVEGQTRLAALAARAHGAERLVDKLEARLLAIAPSGQQG